MGDRFQTLRAVLHQEGGEWVAHCLDLDIVSTGQTLSEATHHLAEAVTAQLEYAREHDNYAYLWRLAPPDAWQRLTVALQGKQPTQRVPITKQEPVTFLEFQTAA
jgi:predicted RNase H-like HicB family nuclease